MERPYLESINLVIMASSERYERGDRMVGAGSARRKRRSTLYEVVKVVCQDLFSLRVRVRVTCRLLYEYFLLNFH